MQDEEQVLRTRPGDVMLPADPFTSAVGKFWGFGVTRDYMRARYALVEAMGQIHNVEATQARLDQCMDMLRLNQSDNMGVRSTVPALMLRLNKDQECYSFIKWWAQERDSYDWDWSNAELETKDADAFEDVECFSSSCPDLSHLVSLTLLKVKLLLDVMKVQRSASAVLGQSAPSAIARMVKTATPQSPLVRENDEILDGDDMDIQELAEQLEGQIEELFDRADNANNHFWKHLTNPGDYLHSKPEAYSMGSMEEMAITLQLTYDAWCETPGAMDFINAKTTGYI